MKKVLLFAVVSVVSFVGCGSTEALNPVEAGRFGEVRFIEPENLESMMRAQNHCATVDFGPLNLPREGTPEEMSALAKAAAGATASKTIKVAFHVILNSSGAGDLSDDQIKKQIDVLNSAYASLGYQFSLVKTDRTTNNTWFNLGDGSSAERKMKNSLAYDVSHTLNIYSANLRDDLLGWAYFPWSYSESNKIHGLVLLYSSMPGGSAAPYNLGDTAVHEIGHYLGLYHTFEGGCSGQGDRCNDTPAESSPAFGCPKGRDTCSASGTDPIYNFMDYTDDSCMDRFSANQTARVQWALSTYRPNL